jgi:predicted transcriptional regulator YdeE
MRIEDLGEIRIVGVLTRFRNALHDEYDGMSAIPEVWQELNTRSEEIENRSPGFAYGVMLGEEEGFTKYLAGFATAIDFTTPKSMKAIAIPAGLWAVFTHYGSLDNLQESNRYAYQEWLPNSEYQMRMSPHIEFYSPKSEGSEENMEMEFWIPIELEL